MTDVGLVHMDLESKGGGEAVAMNALDALQDDYDVTLLTLTDPDIEALNDYFDVTVDPDALTVRRAGRLAPALHRRFGVGYYILQNALLSRYARRHADEFDLLVSTINELGLPDGSIEYVHFPFDWTVNLDQRNDIFHPTVEEDSLYERLCTRVAGITAENVRSNTLLANSEWTAAAVEEAYDTDPEVLYPPIDTRPFTDRPWSERENGFVAIGRVERSKRVDDMIRILDGLRERGHDAHLHVVGPPYDDEYWAELQSMAADRDYVNLEGELPRGELIERICSHRYGIHGKECEHFGMAVAELVAGGAVPFVPDSGGQQAIVRDDRRLQYESPADAVEKIDRVLSDPDLQRELKLDAGEIERRFGRERFRERFRAAVATALDRPAMEERPTRARSPRPPRSSGQPTDGR